MTKQEQIEEMPIRLPKIEEIEKDYKEWCVNLIKVRFDLKPEYYDEHHHNNYTYENCADCLWNRIKGTIEELLWLKEDYYKLYEQLNLWKDKVEQASKETAKEIYGEIEKSDILIVDTQEYGEIEVVPIERLNEIFRSKGVEVEE